MSALTLRISYNVSILSSKMRRACVRAFVRTCGVCVFVWTSVGLRVCDPMCGEYKSRNRVFQLKGFNILSQAMEPL